MTFATLPNPASTRAGAAAARPAGSVSPRLARCLVAGAVLAGGVAGWLSTDPVSAAEAAARAGADLTRLLRAMAAIKMALAVAVLAGMWWRMASPTPAARLAAYFAAAAAMSAGPVMIWGIAQVTVGALVLHAGLITGLAVLWRDPDVTRRIAAIVDGRRRGASSRRRPVIPGYRTAAHTPLAKPWASMGCVGAPATARGPLQRQA